jgi:hypothetical protein
VEFPLERVDLVFETLDESLFHCSKLRSLAYVTCRASGAAV